MPQNALHEGLKTHFSPEQIKQLASVRVGIAGAGGLGSNVAVHLVRTGIRRLVVADFDRVAPSNLNRQFYFADQVGLKKVAALEANLRRIDPDVELKTMDLRLTADNVERKCGAGAAALSREQAAGGRALFVVSEVMDLRHLVVSAQIIRHKVRISIGFFHP